MSTTELDAGIPDEIELQTVAWSETITTAIEGNLFVMNIKTTFDVTGLKDLYAYDDDGGHRHVSFGFVKPSGNKWRQAIRDTDSRLFEMLRSAGVPLAGPL